MTAAPLLTIRNLSLSYRLDDRWQPTVQDVSLDLIRGEVFGLVGESGCGKSTLAMQVLGYRSPAARLDGGWMMFHGRDILAMPPRELQTMRGRLISFVPQNPATALSPAMAVGDQIGELLLRHRMVSARGESAARVADLLEQVGLPGTPAFRNRFAHQISGGERQRVAIARALVAEPALLLCDEILSALDVSVQAHILALLAELKRDSGVAMLFISHDLAVVRSLADQVGVLYRGEIVETGPVARLFAPPYHPYTQALLQAIPRRSGGERRMISAPGTSLHGMAAAGGCVFAARCGVRIDGLCQPTPPPLRQLDGGLTIRCHHAAGDLPRSLDTPQPLRGVVIPLPQKTGLRA